MAATELTSHSEQTRHPSLHFDCSGNIIKWTVGARIAEDQQERAPNIIITRFNQSTNAFELSSLNATAHFNVYEHKLNDPEHFNPGQFITVDSTQIYYQRCIINVDDTGQCRDLPLIAVDIGNVLCVCTGIFKYCWSIFQVVEVTVTHVLKGLWTLIP